MTKSNKPQDAQADPRQQGKNAEPPRPAHDESKRREAEDSKATQFDGSPNPVGTDRSPLKPKDDTPAFLEKKSGPRTGRP